VPACLIADWQRHGKRRDGAPPTPPASGNEAGTGASPKSNVSSIRLAIADERLVVLVIVLVLARSEFSHVVGKCFVVVFHRQQLRFEFVVRVETFGGCDELE
jgi:hypothetical protein